MLTHRNVATTQIYTEVMDKNKRKAAESLTIKKK
jgi:site-specific recombinase XerD